MNTIPQASTQTWDIDAAHSGVHFTVRHMVISKVRGRFTQFSGAISTEGEARLRSAVNVGIQAASIDTDNEQRDGHLKSADFLDAEKYPTITFDSVRVENVDDDHFRLHGTLTLHGISREVVLEVEDGGRARDPWGGERMGFTARTSVRRKDFGLEWNQVLETGGVLVGDTVDITIEIEAVPKA